MRTITLIIIHCPTIILGHRDLTPDLDNNGKIEPREWVKFCPCFGALLDYEDLQSVGLQV